MISFGQAGLLPSVLSLSSDHVSPSSDCFAVDAVTCLHVTCLMQDIVLLCTWFRSMAGSPVKYSMRAQLGLVIALG